MWIPASAVSCLLESEGEGLGEVGAVDGDGERLAACRRARDGQILIGLVGSLLPQEFDTPPVTADNDRVMAAVYTEHWQLRYGRCQIGDLSGVDPDTGRESNFCPLVSRIDRRVGNQ